MDKLKNLIFKPSVAFTKKRDLNKTCILYLSLSLVLLLVVGILFIPSTKLEQTDFHEKVDSNGVTHGQGKDNDPTNQTLQELKASQANLRSMPKPNQFVGMGTLGISPTGAGGNSDRSSSMIVSRSGTDSRNALSVGTRISITLSQGLTISNQSLPVTGIVSHDVVTDDALAIPEGSKVIGDATFDDANDRANLVWKTIILPDGRERQFQAVSVGSDNQVGVQGNIKSDAVKNTIGETITEFVGSFAQGSMTSGMLGQSNGGLQNGLENAVAQTAQDRANAFGEALKKEHRWIELATGTPLTAVLNQSFVFRDPGSTYGK